MIDIHNHILTNIDDGPKSTEEMLELLKQAKEEGVTGIVATPHHLHPSYDNEITKVKTKVEALNNMKEVQTLGITIYSGQEIRASDEILNQIKSGDIEGINQSKYLLIELPSNRVPRFTQPLIYELQTLGFIPIIVHPERNKQIAQDLDCLFELVNAGALSQVTSGSLTGTYGKHIKNISLQMIDNNLVHFIASDAHHASVRPFYLNSLLNHKGLKGYRAQLEELIANSEAVIANQNIRKKQPHNDFKTKKLFGLFGRK